MIQPWAVTSCTLQMYFIIIKPHRSSRCGLLLPMQHGLLICHDMSPAKMAKPHQDTVWVGD